MDNTTNEVYNFFLALEQYAFGDLQLFHEIVEKAEKKDEDDMEENDSFPQYTLYPNSFEFNFGKPLNCRATIPFALMIFSCMDILGFILRSGAVTKQDLLGTKDNIKEFYKHVSSELDTDKIDCLIDLFRHGLAHNYFPKLNQPISYHTKKSLTLFSKDQNGICLHVDVLEAHFTEGFNKIRNDESLHSDMEKRFSGLNKYYLETEKCKLLNN